jgi:hypothetical protein
MVWGSNTNGELGVGDTQPRDQPTYIDSILNKQVVSAGAGGAFAFALGLKFGNVNKESSFTYITEEGTLTSHKKAEVDHSAILTENHKHSYNINN